MPDPALPPTLPPALPSSLQPALNYARRHTLQATLATVLVLVSLYAALAPVPAGPREHMLHITPGTLARKTAGDINAALPLDIYLTVGVRDVLHIRNSDSAPHFIGAVALAPGESIRVPFDEAGRRQLPSSAHFDGSVTIVTGPWPDPGMQRLLWRVREWIAFIRHY